jgi:endoglucanase
VSADGNGSVDKKEATKWMEVIDEYGLSTCIWNLSNKDEGSALINAASEAKTDWEYDDLSEQGQYFFDLISDGDYKIESTATKSEDEEESEEEDETENTDKSKTSDDSKETVKKSNDKKSEVKNKKH